MSRPVVSLPCALRSAILSEARAAAPRECCGLLVGAGLTVRFAVPVGNTARGTTRYRVDPRSHLQWQRALRAVVPALGVIGAYHSHPAGPASPSARDIREARDPRWLHVIVGTAATRPRFGAFRITDGRVERLALRWR